MGCFYFIAIENNATMNTTVVQSNYNTNPCFKRFILALSQFVEEMDKLYTSFCAVAEQEVTLYIVDPHIASCMIQT